MIHDTFNEVDFFEKFMNKKSIIYANAALILAIVIVGGFWVWRSNQKVGVIEEQGQEQEQSKNQQAEIDTSNWKTYQSDGWGYSIKYPDNLYIKADTQGDKFPGDTCPMCGNGGQTLIISDLENMGIQDVNPEEGIHVVVSTRKLSSIINEKNKTVENYLENNYKGKISKIKINDINVYKIDPEFGENKINISMSIFIVKDDWLYNLLGVNYSDKNLNSYNIKLMDKIFSTFKFTK